MGRVFLAAIDDPFRIAEREIARVREAGARIILVDMHAETTSEKIALSWFLDGKVTAVIGTHTHVQTADERILPGGTACLTDAGMTGPHDGVIGMERGPAIAKFVTGLPTRMEPASSDNRLHGVVITADAETGTRHGDRARRPHRSAAAEPDRFGQRGADAVSRLPFDEEKRSAAAPPRVPAPERRILTVSELSTALRNEIESRFHSVWVEGEVSNLRRWNTGHVYFTLKDNASQIKGVMFRSTLRTLRFAPEDGLRVVARGRVSVYEPKGEYQLVCEHMEPQGFGPLQLAFEQLKKKLSAEGLFDAARKRPLPALPRRIGIVTSLDGAALRDIVRVLRRRYPNAHLVIGPTRVQGDGAAADIASAINVVSRIDHVDVVILARGGGSLEDLWAFNEEVVARAIARAAVPVICGVGHETDVTIADFVADVRAPTPSAAAELVVRRKDDFFAHIDRLGHRVHSAMQRSVLRRRARLQALEAQTRVMPASLAGSRGAAATCWS